VDLKFNHMVKDLTPINERLCIIRIKGRFFNYSLISIHAPTNGSEKEAKDHFYDQRTYTTCPRHDVKLEIGDANAKICRETRGAKSAYKLALTRKRRLFSKKARQLEEKSLIEIE
jgi:hypothetical protein